MMGEPQKVRLDMADADTTSKNEHVLYMVMSYLPTKDCVRTSVLSSNWRYKWTTIPILVFDPNSCPPSIKGDQEKRAPALTSIINGVLHRHTSSIQVLQVKDVCYFPEIDERIFNASKGSFESRFQKQCEAQAYMLPPSVYACETLVDLKLSRCILSPPLSFKGFKNLRCLDLSKVTLTDDAFEELISSCPLLEELKLANPRSFNNLKIDAQNLQHIHIRGLFKDITFGNVLTKLLTISIYLDQYKGTEDSEERQFDLKVFCSKLPNIQQLELTGCSIDYLAGRSFPETMRHKWKYLHHLAICIDYNRRRHCFATLCLVVNSPNLTELEIMPQWEDDDDVPKGVWGELNRRYRILQKLRTVKITIACGTNSELELIEFLLRNSVVLEKMVIVCKGLEMMTWQDTARVAGFKRASATATIFINDHMIQKCLD